MNDLSPLVRAAAEPLTGSASDYDSLLHLVGDARLVLLGEATHGTHEFYRERARITQRLIREKNFRAVAVEGDWPDAYQVNRFVRGASPGGAVEALAGFKRFPQWMWRNADVVEFIQWLREHNDTLKSDERKAGFYGLDLYSLRASIAAVLAYLRRVDPVAAGRARQHYGCFDHFGPDTQRYGAATAWGMSRTCEEEVLKELTELRRRESDYLQRDGRVAAEDYFCAEQNASVIKSAEHYYRSMFQSDVSSWNLRDRHMIETLVSLVAHLEKTSQPAKVVIWAHNSHVGNARATAMSQRGEYNLGQLVRTRYGREAILIGFTTYDGTVTAASQWDEPAECKRVCPAVPESYENLFHHTGHPRFWLAFPRNPGVAFHLREVRLERAIGVIYRPETELVSHYFNAQLPDQFDAILHFDRTTAVQPLEKTPQWEAGEVDETYPTGL